MAYYIFSNFQVDGQQKYNINPNQGFLLPQESILIRVSKHVSTEDELRMLENVEDLLFVKALPLNESQVNETNLHSFNLKEVFHQHNVNLMFTLEAITTEFVDEPIQMPIFEQQPTVIRKTSSTKESIPIKNTKISTPKKQLLELSSSGSEEAISKYFLLVINFMSYNQVL